MGVAIAEECYLRGANVLLLCAKTSVRPRYLIKEKIFETAGELMGLIKENIKNTDLFFQAAAVSDFKVDQPIRGKISSDRSINLKLIPQIKIIVNKNTIPYDTRSPFDPSGIRIGTAAVTTSGMKEKDIIKIAIKIDKILKKHANH